MKKLLSLLLVLILSLGVLAACGADDNSDGSSSSSVPGSSSSSDGEDNSDTTQKTEINLTVLNGSTGFGMAQLMENNANGKTENVYNVNIATVVGDVEKALIAGTVDIAALPTNSAAKVYNKTNGQVQILAINTLGVLYMIDKTGTVNSINDLSGKTVYVPSDNPNFITKHIINSNGVKNVTIDSTTFPNPQALQAAVKAGQVDIAVLPQPVVTAAMAGAKQAGFEYKIALDMTAEWDRANDEQLVQGCIVVRKDFASKNKGAIENFLKEYEESINYLNNNPKDAAGLIVKHGIFANATVAEKAIPKSNVVFIIGNEMKSAMSAYVLAMFNIDKESVGEKIPQDDFYYIK